ncbi:hypothetical protein [Stratiformator vulcanicus]|uniref:Phage virion morphogenesis family protein n=1 Tax=Stratiformator vulcanicus TaxID=2527980 RepID=A0A517R748_9PLAN|nr:hypothetical protein [Stratiformator vulcanicus]QDT39727.1 hypothetical protein Pan189_41360 [Stratiformator vulcanicus]
MADIDIKFIKNRFFDKKVTSSLDRAARRILSRFGAFVRRSSKSSIRKRKTPSQPGQPPSSHVGTLKRFIFFAFDARDQSVTIGPMRFRSTHPGGDGKPIKGTVPEALEDGGMMRIVERYGRVKVGRTAAGRGAGGRFTKGEDIWGEGWARISRKRGPSAYSRTRKRTVAVGQRPYMVPAHEKNLGHLAQWRNSMR